MSETDPTSDVAVLTVELLSAYLANNTVPSTELADLIRSTRAALTEHATPAAEPTELDQFTPAVSIRKSLASSAHIISLIDGRPYKTLKRHLASHGLTPDAYRSRYNLPASYPMVAPDYAAHRRAVAQKIGLGSRKSSRFATEDATASADVAQGITRSDVAEAQVPEAPLKRTPRASGNNRALAAKNYAPDAAQSDAQALPTVVDGDDTARAADEEMKLLGGKSRARRQGATSARANSEGARAAELSTAALASTENTPAQSADTTKRRARIGLFKKAEHDGAVEAKGDAEPKKAAAKAKKPKRMARTPDPRATSQGDPEESGSSQG